MKYRIKVPAITVEADDERGAFAVLARCAGKLADGHAVDDSEFAALGVNAAGFKATAEEVGD